MLSGDFVNKVTQKIEYLYVEVKYSHLITFLISRCKLVYELFVQLTVNNILNK